jgi:hypothetical protein
MWPAFLVIAWFILALAAPAGWALWGVWRRARGSRQVTCPEIGAPALVALDPWYAVRKHALGDNELRVSGCARWPERRDCGRECLTGAGRTA